jgi:hypothetical protein
MQVRDIPLLQDIPRLVAVCKHHDLHIPRNKMKDRNEHKTKRYEKK